MASHPLLPHAPAGKRVDEVLKAVLDAGKQHARRITTATLNMVLKEATGFKSPPTQRTGGRKGKMYYATQAASRPPAFVFFVNDPKLFPDDYRRYIERQLRDNIGFPGTPLRLLWRGKPERDVNRPRPPPSSGPAGSGQGAGGRGQAGGRGLGAGRGR